MILPGTTSLSGGSSTTAAAPPAFSLFPLEVITLSEEQGSTWPPRLWTSTSTENKICISVTKAVLGGGRVTRVSHDIFTHVVVCVMIGSRRRGLCAKMDARSLYCI